MIATDAGELVLRVYVIQNEIARLEFALAEKKIELARLMAAAALKGED